MSIRPEPPDVHFIEMVYAGPQGNFREQVLYIRVLVNHVHGRTAENLELFAARVWEVDANGNRRLARKFLPMPLLWSNTNNAATPGGATSIRIPPGVYRHCDLGYLARAGQFPTKLVVSTAVQPFGVGTTAEPASVFRPGVYDIDVVLSGDNAGPTEQSWRITFDASWVNDEAQMLERVTITPAPERPESRESFTGQTPGILADIGKPFEPFLPR